MRRSARRGLIALALTSTVLSGVPVQAICWGSLYVVSRSQRLVNRCPHPTLTKRWRLQCYDGCGYTAGTFLESLSGFGECFKAPHCSEGTRCLPLAGAEMPGFNPPSLSAAMINRQGYYALPPCSLPSCRNAGINTLTVYCPCDPDGDPSYCAQNDPIVVSLRDGRYLLTDRTGGVTFDLGDTGSPEQVPWSDPDGDEAFLALDRDGNGSIDNGRELFGDVTPQHPSGQPNGFLALAVFDDALSGGNEDGRISAADAIFQELRLWRDADHDGQSDPDELLTLAAAGLVWIDLDYQESQRVDRHGNAFRYRAASGWAGGAVQTIWNVFLTAP